MSALLTGYEDAKTRKAHSDASGFKVVGDSLTVQADSRDADINVIMERYARTGQLPPLPRLPSFGDFDGINDFRTAIHAVQEAEDLFMGLPAKVRARFDNDPALFIEFCDKPENRAELAGLGLLSKEATDAIQKEQEALRAAEAGKGGEAAAAAGNQSGRPAKASKPGKGGETAE